MNESSITNLGRLSGRVAVITGGGNGIGRATAERFARDGAAVVIADVQKGAADDAAGAIESSGRRAVACQLDAANRDDNEAMAALAVSTFGRLDILCTAAGISHSDYRSGDIENDAKFMLAAQERQQTPGRAFLELEREQWQRVIDVNLTGTLLAMQACAARMIESGNGGSIITIASIAAKNPDAGPLAYTVSKAGVWMLTKKAARELADSGIRVNAIGPGYIDTNMTKLIDFAPADRQELLMNAIPMKRRGQPSEIASVAAFLASDDASYMTGTILHPDGGYFTD